MSAAWGTRTPGRSASPLSQADSIREMQRQLAETNAAVRLLHEQRKQEFSARTRKPSLFDSRHDSPKKSGLSQLWYEDDIERQAGQQRRSQHYMAAHQPSKRYDARSTGDSRSYNGSSLRYEVDVYSLMDRNKALQAELLQVQEEKAVLEGEALAFKQRMEAAVNSFEGIIEQAVAEKTRMYQQLVSAKQQLQTAREQLEQQGGRSLRVSEADEGEADLSAAFERAELHASHERQLAALRAEADETARSLQAELSERAREAREAREAAR
eukprot:6010215-Pleurochrysis_carterae.AAC.1